MFRRLARRIPLAITILGLRAPYVSGGRNLHAVSDRLRRKKLESSLDLGSGSSPNNFFLASRVVGVDIRSYDDNDAVLKCNMAAESLPFPDLMFDCVTAFDVLEHIPRSDSADGEPVFPFVVLMNEIWRVLRRDGYFFSITPCYPMKQAFQDPTHVNIMTEDTLRLYFCESAWARIYGYEGSFALVDEGWRRTHYWCLMKKSGIERIEARNSKQAP